MRDEEEEGGGEDPADCGLHVTELDAVQVHYAQHIRRRKAIEAKDLEHLEGGYESASSLTNDV